MHFPLPCEFQGVYVLSFLVRSAWIFDRPSSPGDLTQSKRHRLAETSETRPAMKAGDAAVPEACSVHQSMCHSLIYIYPELALNTPFPHARVHSGAQMLGCILLILNYISISIYITTSRNFLKQTLDKN